MSLDPATLGPVTRRLYDLRMAGHTPKEIAEQLGWQRKTAQGECQRLERRGAEFPRLPKGKPPVNLDRQIERVVACKRKGMSIRAIVRETGLQEGRVAYFATLARRRGMDVPFVPGGGVSDGAAAVKLCGTWRGYRRCVVAATEEEARAGWAAWAGGEIERVEVIR